MVGKPVIEGSSKAAGLVYSRSQTSSSVRVRRNRFVSGVALGVLYLVKVWAETRAAQARMKARPVGWQPLSAKVYAGTL